MFGTSQADGKAQRTRTYKRRRRCSSPRWICIACQKAPIHLNDRNYPGRVCEGCLSRGIGPVRSGYSGPERLAEGSEKKRRDREILIAQTRDAYRMESPLAEAIFGAPGSQLEALESRLAMEDPRPSAVAGIARHRAGQTADRPVRSEIQGSRALLGASTTLEDLDFKRRDKE